MNNFICLILILFLLCAPSFAYQEDTTAKLLIGKNTQKPVQNLNYDYQSLVSVPIELKIVQKAKDKHLTEGQILEFKVQEDVLYNNKILLKKDEIVTARVETLIANGMNGIPASIVLGGFRVPNLESSKVSQKYEHFGLDLSLFVFPLKWALTPLPPTGSLTNFIKGGRATLGENKTITIFYYPEW